jgi:hypothetical protein
MAALIVLVVIGTAIWVGFDAPARGLSWTWALGCLALWIVAFPWYLVERQRAPGRAPQRASPPPRTAPAPETDLQRLQRMRAEGQLSQAQYDAEKRRLERRYGR